MTKDSTREYYKPTQADLKRLQDVCKDRETPAYHEITEFLTRKRATEEEQTRKRLSVDL